MVYLAGTWGMGETEPQCHSTTTSPVTASFLKDHDEEVALHPLNNQVGGHTRLLLLNQNTICKPLNYRELEFYQNIPQDIQMFVPKFKGVMQASSSSEVSLDKRYSPSFRDQAETTNTRQGKGSTKRKRDDVLRMKIHRNNCTVDVLKPETHLESTPNTQHFLMLENITSRYTHPCILDLKMGTRQYSDDASAEKRSKQIAKCAASTSASLGVRLCGMQVYQADSDHYVKRDKYWGRELNEEGFKAALYRFFHNGFGLRTLAIQRVIARLELLRRAIERQSSYRFYSCSLLVVYEGYQIDGFSVLRHTPTLRVEEESTDLNFMENIAHGSETCYDADTSNNSNDYNLSSHEEVSQATLHRGFGEAAARGAKNASGFYPINEETVFMDSPTNMVSTVVQSSQFDNWMMYSSSSGDEFCCGQHTADSSEDTSSDLEMESTGCVLKRNRPRQHLRLYENTKHVETEDECSSISKRLRVKTDEEKQSESEDSLVDVRMIDFANMSFNHSGSSVGSSNSNSTIHQGPDCGFLTGLDSLKRLLLEILTEG
ncbi:inositol hexakisphosphate kinase 1 isoform X1 [Neodiprion virginianus]|uniref:inositol hexakisphosphate kinase 1 isoform X1 n=1 Tax=Neodiprion virginianus TaxID=2961670 RepID=UPI001EE75C1E|nr:inositol hexakisphosphate kinase 1 isoform X1 [Neodiprion virginianus]XP_046621998.1 inositol hexakisphosphate kinase 1 isoform X1 [Neodiprion virginianus]XP_046621999.1 inositol hexakisphosphate kinase 1 isoform X1 [Neodiprion virginianus]